MHGSVFCSAGGYTGGGGGGGSTWGTLVFTSVGSPCCAVSQCVIEGVGIHTCMWVGGCACAHVGVYVRACAHVTVCACVSHPLPAITCTISPHFSPGRP